MVVGRNRTLNTTAQISVLKMMLKWRDYVARVDDESPAYMFPNHIMFQISKDLPKTANELRDSCRATLPPAVQKYQNDLLSLIKQKVERKPKEVKSTVNLNIKFDAVQPVEQLIV